MTNGRIDASADFGESQSIEVTDAVSAVPSSPSSDRCALLLPSMNQRPREEGFLRSVARHVAEPVRSDDLDSSARATVDSRGSFRSRSRSRSQDANDASGEKDGTEAFASGNAIRALNAARQKRKHVNLSGNARLRCDASVPSSYDNDTRERSRHTEEEKKIDGQADRLGSAESPTHTDPSSSTLDAKAREILAEAQRACAQGIHLRVQQRSNPSFASSEVLSSGTDTGLFSSDVELRANEILEQARNAAARKTVPTTATSVSSASYGSDAPTDTHRTTDRLLSGTAGVSQGRDGPNGKIGSRAGTVAANCNGASPRRPIVPRIRTEPNTGERNTSGINGMEEFLVLAEQRSKEAAAEAVREVENGIRIRTTKEVLQLATSTLHRLQPSPGSVKQTNAAGLKVGTDGHPLIASPRPDYQPAQSSHDPTPNDDDDDDDPSIDNNTAGSSNQSGTSGSPPNSDAGSVDDYEVAVDRLASKMNKIGVMSRDKILKKIDGMPSPHAVHRGSHVDNTADSFSSLDSTSIVAPVKRVVVQEVVDKSAHRRTAVEQHKTTGAFSFLDYLWGNNEHPPKVNELGIMNPLSCGPVTEKAPAVASSLVRVKSDDAGFVETVNSKMKVDPRMPDWFSNQLKIQSDLSPGSVYHLGDSKTVIVHEIQRGSWTWTTAWSPDGKRLAMATEGHHLAVVDTSSSAVWRVHHDKKIVGAAKKDTTHTVRSIAWGRQFIAIGGTGNVVSILAPTEPYPVLHTIKNTGFVGSLDWLAGTNTLVIGSRTGKALIVKIWARDDRSHTGPIARRMKEIDSTQVHVIDRASAWVNAVSFSPGGQALAVADSHGILSIYSYQELRNESVQLHNLANFRLEDSIMSLEWSSDGHWLYSGGEDFAVTIINTKWWEAVHRIKRDRWVQFIASSSSGTHVAVGGVSSEVSILEVDKGWDTILNVSLKGLVPLSAQWHPQDQYLVLTGQNNSVVAIETTNARYVTGHMLRSINPILAVEFSPDGRMAAVGNEAGVITIFKLSGSTFITCYEAVIDCDGSLSIVWSRNGAYVCVVSGTKLVIIGKTKSADLPSTAPPNTSGFCVVKVVTGLGSVHAVAIHPGSRYYAVCGEKRTILDSTSGFECCKEWRSEDDGKTLACAWSDDGSWLATVGQQQPFTVYDTTSDDVSGWRPVFTVETEDSGMALAWGPPVARGLQYCAFGGAERDITIMEIRSIERTWEIILVVPRDGVVHDLDWNSEGLLAAAIDNGTVTVLDTSYLQSGWAVSEMDYTWQRQALTCLTEIRRNRGVNSMRAVRWIPSAPGSDTLLAVGGTDGEIEIIDLTERERCSGFNKAVSSI